MNHYELLGLAPGASPDEIRTAYRTLVQIFHPDRLSQFKPESRAFAEERMKGINQAYAVLSDPAKRAAYDVTLSQPAPLPRANVPGGMSHPVPPTPGTPAARRSAVLERRRRRARLEAEIADLVHNVAELEAQARRARARWRTAEARTTAGFWTATTLTGLGFNSVLLIGVGIFAQPPGVLHALAQRLAFVLVVALYEFASALAITLACRMPGARLSLWGTLRQTGWGLIFAWAVGLAGWAVWAGLYGGALDNLSSLLLLALTFALAHAAFCWAALGHLPRLAREQQRVFEHAYAPMVQAYQHTLTQLRAQKAAVESETA
jgi:hypothetical protein